MPSRSANLSEQLDLMEQLLTEARKERDEALAALSRNTESLGVVDIALERRRMIEEEGWTSEHDDTHDKGEMARAAACYAWVASTTPPLREVEESKGWWSWPVPVNLRHLWPWAREWWKPKDPRRDLVRAGALIAAEIDRLDRATMRGAGADERGAG